MTTDDAPRPTLDAAMVERLRERYGPEEPPSCPVCGAAMDEDDDAGNLLPHRETWWRCPQDGERVTTIVLLGHDPDVLALLDTLPSLLTAAAERTALAREAVELRRALDWYALGRQDGGLWAQFALGRGPKPAPGEGDSNARRIDGHAVTLVLTDADDDHGQRARAALASGEGAGKVGPTYVRRRSAELRHEWARLTAAFAAAQTALLRYEQRGDDGGKAAREWLTIYAGMRQRPDGAWEQKGDGDAAE